VLWRFWANLCLNHVSHSLFAFSFRDGTNGRNPVPQLTFAESQTSVRAKVLNARYLTSPKREGARIWSLFITLGNPTSAAIISVVRRIFDVTSIIVPTQTAVSGCAHSASHPTIAFVCYIRCLHSSDAVHRHSAVRKETRSTTQCRSTSSVCCKLLDGGRRLESHLTSTLLAFSSSSLHRSSSHHHRFTFMKAST
jgi:hypothetical protein